MREKTVRLLHVVENMDSKAVESWLFRSFHHAVERFPLYHWTFFCTLPEAGTFDKMVRETGGEVVHTRYEIGDSFAFMSDLRRVMKEGHYDVLHCHHDIMSAVYLTASLGLPFRQRIVHVHNTATHLLTPSPFKRALLHRPMREICLRVADQLVGISQEALSSILGNKGRKPGRDSVVHYGINTAPFTAAPPDSAELRRELGLDPRAKILLFVGRMVEYKKPCHLVEMLSRLAQADPDIVAVFAGTGDHEAKVRELAERRAIADRIRILGFRQDVPRLMQGADLLIWPSMEEPKEGLGLGIVEAQAAGLPVLMSRSVPQEAVVIPELVEIMPLAAGYGAWADAALSILGGQRPTKEEALARVEASTFSLEAGVSNLMSLYTQAVPRVGYAGSPESLAQSD